MEWLRGDWYEFSLVEPHALPTDDGPAVWTCGGGVSRPTKCGNARPWHCAWTPWYLNSLTCSALGSYQRVDTPHAAAFLAPFLD